MRQLVDSGGSTAIPNPIESTAIARPNHTVLITDEGTWTARELRDAVRRFAASLAANGVTPRSRVGLIGPPSAEWVIASHAIGWLGASVTPLPHDQPVAELEKAVAVANPAALVVTSGHDESQRDELERVSGGRLFEMRTLTGDELVELPERFWPWNEERATLLTSGTTGVAQPIPVTTAQFVMSAYGSSIRLGHHLDDTWVACLPLNHVGGFSILTRAVLNATTVVLHPRFIATRVAKLLDSGDVSLVSLVPTMLERILEVRGDDPFPENLRAILVGGAGISAELLDRCRSARVPVALTWGMTEAASQITTRFPGDLSADGGSGVPLPFARVRPEQNGETLTVYGPTARGVHRTRDLGHVDEDGRVHITGRRDDTIVSGGENIAPSEVENVLRAHDLVRDAIVVGIPNVRWGERPIALLVAASEHTPTDEELAEWCKDRLAKFKVPEHFLWVDQIPLGPLGKRPRARARKLAQELAPELFAGEEADSAQTGEELVGHRAGLESRQVDCSVHQLCNRSRLAVSSVQRVPKRQGLGGELLELDNYRQTITQPDRSLKVSLGMNQRSSPAGLRIGTGEGVFRIAENRHHQLLERLVAVLEDPTEEHDADLIDFVEASRDHVLKTHSYSSRAKERAS